VENFIMRKKNIKRRKKNLNEISPGIGALAGTGLGGAVSAGANYYIYRKKIKELENKKNECGGSRYCEETIQKKINDLKANLKYSLLKTGLTGAAFGALGGFGLSALGNKKPVSPTATQQTIQPNTQNTTQQPSNSNVPPSVQDVKTDGTTVNTQQQPNPYQIFNHIQLKPLIIPVIVVIMVVCMADTANLFPVVDFYLQLGELLLYFLHYLILFLLLLQ